MSVSKLNKTFTSSLILTTAEMNAITNKIDAVIDDKLSLSGGTVTGATTFKSTPTINQEYSDKGAAICLDTKYTPGNTDWPAYIAADYYGNYWCSTPGYTHGLFFKGGRSTFDNFNFISVLGLPLAKIGYDGGVTATAHVTSANGNVYIGETSGSRCHQQYDSTQKCLKFIFD